MNQFILIIMLSLLVQSCTANTTVVNNDLFSLEVPSQWEMKPKEMGQNKIFVTSQHTNDGWPTKMMMVDYCVTNNQENTGSLLNCNESCSEEKLLHYMSKLKEFGKDIRIKKHFNKNGYPH